jgi:hypothetical protein
MGEVEQAFERLNKILVEAGFSKAEMTTLGKVNFVSMLLIALIIGRIFYGKR